MIRLDTTAILSSIMYSFFYYIHNEKYSPKSYVVNFHSQMSSSQSESEQWFSHVKKMIRPIRIASDVFFTCEKNHTSNQKPQRSVSFAPKFLPFIGACSLQRPFADIQREKFFSKYFSRKSEKLLANWSGIVSFVLLSMK